MEYVQWWRPGGGGGTVVPPNPESRQKLSKKDGIESVGYTFRLKDYVKSSPPPTSFRFFRAGNANGYVPIFRIRNLRNQALVTSGRGLEDILSIINIFHNISSLRFSRAPDYLAVIFGGPSLYQI